MIRPNYLKKGDTIGIVSPAGKIAKSILSVAENILTQKGFHVVTAPHAFNHHHQFSGNDQERLSDLQHMLDREDISAIICSRGGYGTIRIIDQLNFKKFRKHPKWVVGFSDITVLHSCLQQKQSCQSIHGIMPKHFVDGEDPSEDFERLIGLLEGTLPVYETRPHPLNRPGVCLGELNGGNLSLLYALRGTRYDIKPDGKILFIEDLNEYLYHLDRMMHNLKLGGILQRISGLVVGQFTDMKDNATPFGQEAAEIIRASVDAYDYPVMFNFPAGHSRPNYPLVLGDVCQLTVEENNCSLNFNIKQW